MGRCPADGLVPVAVLHDVAIYLGVAHQMDALGHVVVDHVCLRFCVLPRGLRNRSTTRPGSTGTAAECCSNQAAAASEVGRPGRCGSGG